MKIVTLRMAKVMRATARMTRKEVVSADLTEINNAIDDINGEIIAGQALDKLAVAEQSKYDIKTAIESYSVDVDDAPLSAYAGLIEDIGDSVEATFKTALDAVNEESSADLTAGIALVDSNYGEIKAAITAAGVDMTGVLPSEYDNKILEAAFSGLFTFDTSTGEITAYNHLVGPSVAIVPPLLSGVVPVSLTGLAYRSLTGLKVLPGLVEIKTSGSRDNLSMTFVELADSVTNIGVYAFYACPLTRIKIGAGVNIELDLNGSYPTMGDYGFSTSNPQGFESLYNGNGKLAGTYEYAAGTWTKTA